MKRLHHQHYGVYGRRKMHALLRREGWEIGRDACERLMKLALRTFGGGRARRVRFDG
ncbi:IS3 family transposase [Pseudoclavibacter helvolus]